MARRPRISRPKLPTIPEVKAPDWWAGVASIKSYGLSSLRRSQNREPAGDPPPDWPGTRPEWAVYWALQIKGLTYGVDFEYRRKMDELLARRYGEVDFLIWSALIAIEVQGTYWHYGIGTIRQENDSIKKAIVESAGFYMIWIDSDMALEDPLYFAGEALQGRDHSRQATGLG